MDTNEDTAYVAWMDAQYEAFQLEYSDYLVEQAYLDWASDARADGEDDSRDAYLEYLEGLIPDD